MNEDNGWVVDFLRLAAVSLVWLKLPDLMRHFERRAVEYESASEEKR